MGILFCLLDIIESIPPIYNNLSSLQVVLKGLND